MLCCGAVPKCLCSCLGLVAQPVEAVFDVFCKWARIVAGKIGNDTHAIRIPITLTVIGANHDRLLRCKLGQALFHRIYGLVVARGKEHCLVPSER